jgi:hypothetical protein
MNFLGGIKSRIKGIYQTSPNENEEGYPSFKMDYEDVQHTLNVIQEENKILKSKVRILENSIFEDKSSSSSSSIATSSQFGKIFQELKSTILYNTDEEPRDILHDFKRFLYENMLLHGSIDEDDLNMLNNIQITDSDWEKKKEIYIFKQKVLEKNYADMFRNLLASNEINTYLRNKGIIPNTTNQVNSSSSNVRKEDEKKEIAYDKEYTINPNPPAVTNLNYIPTSNKNEDNSNIRLDSFNLKREKLSDNSINNNIEQSMTITNKLLSPKNLLNVPKKEKQISLIENKLLSDLIIYESSNHDDNIMKPSPRKERSSIVDNTNNNVAYLSEKNIHQDKKTKNTPITSQRNTDNSFPNANDNKKDDLRISNLLSDNNLTTSINLIDNPKQNRNVENVSKFSKPDIVNETKESKDNFNISNLLVNPTKNTSKTSTNITGNNLNDLTKNAKTDLKKSLLNFADDDEDDFTFGAIVNSDNNINGDPYNKTSLNNANTSTFTNNQKKENLNVNIFESKS